MPCRRDTRGAGERIGFAAITPVQGARGICQPHAHRRGARKRNGAGIACGTATVRVWLILVLGLWSAAAAALSVQDDEHTTLTLAAPAKRIVSIAPHLTELLFDIGAGARVVGTVNYSNYPAAARAVPLVGDNGRLDFARIHNLLGAVTGLYGCALRAAAAYRRELADLRRRYAGRAPVSVVYQVWQTPLMTIGGGQIINEVIELCGGRNIFAALPTLAPTVAVEAVLAANPDVIITSSEQPAAAALAAWKKWPQLRAVRTGQLLTISGGDMARATPQLLHGARRLCELLDTARAADGGR